VVALACSAASPAFPCNTPNKPPPESLVERASLIVHGKAERQFVVPGTAGVIELGGFILSFPDETQVVFKVLRVLKGSLASDATITLTGHLESSDDWNDRPVPYDFVRRGGRQGNCYAFGYRQDGEYLLFLNPGSTPGETAWIAHWAALSPTNEQLRGPDDPWLKWVVQQIK
jgi:hypothetical protein